MKKMFASTLLLLALAGCRTAQQVQPSPSSSADQHSDRTESYNRGYDTESHHHRHRHRDESQTDTDDNWSRYDRQRSDGEANDDATGSRAQTTEQNQTSNRGGNRSRQHHNSRALTAAPGQFDFYVLNLSWSPEFCFSHANAAECAQHRAFTLHGLWPENNDGTYPEDCSEAAGPANPSQYADIYPDPSLLQHEWQTHGTCSGQSPDAFFAMARRADQSIQIPAQLAHLTQQTTLTPGQIITLFTQSNPALPTGSVVLSCGNNFLTAVEVCLDKNLNAQSCSGLKSCGATQVRILPPQSQP